MRIGELCLYLDRKHIGVCISICLLPRICLDYSYSVPKLVGRSKLQAYFKDVLIIGMLITREHCTD